MINGYQFPLKIAVLTSAIACAEAAEARSATAFAGGPGTQNFNPVHLLWTCSTQMNLNGIYIGIEWTGMRDLYRFV